MRKVTLLSLVGAVFMGTPAFASCGLCSLFHKSSCNSCAEKPACSSCQQPVACKPVKCCHKEKQCYTTTKTKWHLVKQCTPRCHTKYVCQKDPCDPCKTTRVAVTEWRNHTSYRWVAECVP